MTEFLLSLSTEASHGLFTGCLGLGKIKHSKFERHSSFRLRYSASPLRLQLLVMPHRARRLICPMHVCQGRFRSRVLFDVVVFPFD